MLYKYCVRLMCNILFGVLIAVLLIIIVYGFSSRSESLDIKGPNPLVGLGPTEGSNASQGGETGTLSIGTTAQAASATAQGDKLPGIAQPSIKSYYDMNDGEKINFIINTYFQDTDIDDEMAKKQQTLDNNYISSLPVDGSCKDDYDSCATWASNGECVINPEYMLYHCAGSCKSCQLTPQQKWNLTVMYNKKPVNNCVYHGKNGSYPDPSVINAHTIKGKGVSFMENDWTWHYRPLSAEQYEKALSENPE